MKHWTVGASAAGVLITSVVAANWLTSTFHFVPVGFGQMSTAGTFAAGFALAARDAIQDAIGKKWMFVALGVATVLSFIVADPHIAAASAIAFGVSELLDFAVYTPIRRKSRLGDGRWAAAVLASGVVGAVADTAIFIGIAFGVAAILPAMLGQLIGKSYAAVSYVLIGKVVSVAVHGEPHQQQRGA